MNTTIHRLAKTFSSKQFQGVHARQQGPSLSSYYSQSIHRCFNQIHARVIKSPVPNNQPTFKKLPKRSPIKLAPTAANCISQSRTNPTVPSFTSKAIRVGRSVASILVVLFTALKPSSRPTSCNPPEQTDQKKMDEPSDDQRAPPKQSNHHTEEASNSQRSLTSF